MACSVTRGLAINLPSSHLRPVSTVPSPIPIFIGYDPRERAATNVLIDSLYQHSSVPLAITPQWRPRSYRHPAILPHSVLVHPFSCAPSDGVSGWALFMDCDMLCRADIGLWDHATRPMARCNTSMW